MQAYPGVEYSDVQHTWSGDSRPIVWFWFMYSQEHPPKNSSKHEVLSQFIKQTAHQIYIHLGQEEANSYVNAARKVTRAITLRNTSSGKGTNAANGPGV